jgi:hypothetical protein
MLCGLALATVTKAQPFWYASDFQALTNKTERTKNIRVENVTYNRCDDHCNNHPLSSTSSFTKAIGR